MFSGNMEKYVKSWGRQTIIQKVQYYSIADIWSGILHMSELDELDGSDLFQQILECAEARFGNISILTNDCNMCPKVATIT